MGQLRKLAVAGNQTVLGSPRNTVVYQNHSAVIIVTLVAIIALTGTGTYFILRRNKEQ